MTRVSFGIPSYQRRGLPRTREGVPRGRALGSGEWPKFYSKQ